jgi:hypothetical protein
MAVPSQPPSHCLHSIYRILNCRRIPKLLEVIVTITPLLNCENYVRANIRQYVAEADINSVTKLKDTQNCIGCYVKL